MTRAPFPSLPAVAGLLVVTMFFGVVIATAVEWALPGLPAILKLALPTQIALVGAIWLAVRLTPIPWREALLVFRPPAGSAWPVVLLTIGAITVFSELYVVIQQIVPVPPSVKALLEEMLQLRGSTDTVATILVAVGLAPLLEEGLFRGVLLQGLARNRGPRAATVWSAAFFALFHLYNPWQLLPTFFLGLLLAWVVLTTRSLLTGITIHAAFNAFSLFLFSAEFPSRAPTEAARVWWAVGVVALLLAGSVAFLWGLLRLETITRGGEFVADAGDPPAVGTYDRTAPGPTLLG